MKPRLLTLIALLTLALGPVVADEVEMLDGTRREGTILGETDEEITLEIRIGRGTAEISIKKKDIHAITTRGRKRIVNEKEEPERPPDPPPAEEDPPPVRNPTRESRTPSEVRALIAAAGKTKPDWWDDVALNYPDTLDLSFGEPPGGWNNQRNVGQFVWDIINPNQHRWKEGVKFMHFVRARNKSDDAVRKKCENSLGAMYHNLLEDHARAAYYWLESGQGNVVGLADCYWKLGSREMAVETIRPYRSDGTRHGSIAKLWADMGDYDRAIEMALGIASAGREDIGYLMAGYAARRKGDFAAALDYFQKSAAAPANRSGRDRDMNIERARALASAVALYDSLDVARVASGTYRDKSIGYNGDVEVSVTVARGKIVDVQVVAHSEKQYYSSIVDIPRQIIDKQGVQEIDGTTGATITADAIVNAAARALAQGKR